MTARDDWARDLDSWAIPPEILAQAPERPWIHPVAQFTPPAQIPDSPSHRRAREALPAGGSVLDVGSGGGRASLAITPPASHIVAVDTQQAMLDVAASQAAARGAKFTGIVGAWPEVADRTPTCDVVVCHHVAYNVAGIGSFVTALSSHATRRVVIELPTRHPLSNLNPLWQHFWGLERPDHPRSDDFVACVRELGIDPQYEVWTDVSWGQRADMTDAERVAMVRVRLCLTADRDPEIVEALHELATPRPHEVATVWWDMESAVDRS